MKRSPLIRALTVFALLWALVVSTAMTALSQSEPPAESTSALSGGSLDLPNAIGDVPLSVERYGPEAMAERLAGSEETLFVTLRVVLDELVDGEPSVSAAFATSGEPSDTGRYELTALRVEGVEARSVVSALFRRLLEDQIRASGTEDPDAIGDLTARLESLIPWRVIDGREVASPNDGFETTFEFLFPTGEILYLGQGQGGLSMAEVLVHLPGGSVPAE